MTRAEVLTDAEYDFICDESWKGGAAGWRAAIEYVLTERIAAALAAQPATTERAGDAADVATVWDEGFEAAVEWIERCGRPADIGPPDPPLNPYDSRPVTAAICGAMDDEYAECHRVAGHEPPCCQADSITLASQPAAVPDPAEATP